MPDLSTEDTKRVTLARAARARTGAAEGAALRDADGRTYAAATVDLVALRVSAVQTCVAMAASSGARSLEAAVVLTGAPGLDDLDLAALREVAAPGAVAHRGDVDGRVADTVPLAALGSGT